MTEDQRALIDAVCRAAEQPLARALRSNQFGIRLGAIHPELAGREPAKTREREAA